MADQYSPHIGVTASADPAKLSLAARAVLTRYQAEERGQVVAVAKRIDVAHRGNDGRGPDCSDPWDAAQALTGPTICRGAVDLQIVRLNTLLQLQEFIAK
jgi:hypothetical protein